MASCPSYLFSSSSSLIWLSFSWLKDPFRFVSTFSSFYKRSWTFDYFGSEPATSSIWWPSSIKFRLVSILRSEFMGSIYSFWGLANGLSLRALSASSTSSFFFMSLRDLSSPWKSFSMLLTILFLLRALPSSVLCDSSSLSIISYWVIDFLKRDDLRGGSTCS